MKNILAITATLLVAFSLATVANADLSGYSQDFEGLDMGDPAALTNDGWLVFGNVFDGNNFLYGYGPFGAPNDGAAFSQIASGSGGANQGLQYLNVFSDYNNQDHANGFTIESNVFQEQIVGADDLGQKFEFLFDLKAADPPFNPQGTMRTFAFIKVLDPDAGFALVAFPTIETTDASTDEWLKGSSISINIEGDWEGNILQFGFLSSGTFFDASGVYYDNISFSKIPEPTSVAVLALGLIGLVARRRR